MRKCMYCDNVHCAKGMCKKHYELKRRRGTHLTKREETGTCIVENCNSIAVDGKKCAHHKKMFDKYGKHYEDYRLASMSGENNPRWNGGVSEYKNHSHFKKIRLKILKKYNNKCATCGITEKLEVHHIDGTKDNHSENNLICLCHICHFKVHAGVPKKTSKFRRIYNMSSNEICELTGYSSSKVRYLHNIGELEEKIVKARNEMFVDFINCPGNQAERGLRA